MAKGAYRRPAGSSLFHNVQARSNPSCTEGIETIMWLVMRGALQENVKVIHKHYHAPISNTGAGVLVLENTFL